jgi:hypothetical protein
MPQAPLQSHTRSSSNDPLKSKPAVDFYNSLQSLSPLIDFLLVCNIIWLQTIIDLILLIIIVRIWANSKSGPQRYITFIIQEDHILVGVSNQTTSKKWKRASEELKRHGYERTDIECRERYELIKIGTSIIWIPMSAKAAGQTSNLKYFIASIVSMEINGSYFRNICPVGIASITQHANQNQKLFLWEHTISPQNHPQKHHKVQSRIRQ